jgi:hypothetical protein
MTLVGAAALSVLTLWILIRGYRIVTGQSRQPLMALVADSLRSTFILGLACGMAVGGSTLYERLGNDLPDVVSQVVTGNATPVNEQIDRSLALMQLALVRIDALHRALMSIVLDGGDLDGIADETSRLLELEVYFTATDGRQWTTAVEPETRELLADSELLAMTGRTRVERLAHPVPLARGQIRMLRVAAGRAELARLVAVRAHGGIGSVDVRELSEASRSRFLSALHPALSESRAQGPSGWCDPSAFPRWMEHFELLLRMQASVERGEPPEALNPNSSGPMPPTGERKGPDW